MLDEVGLSLLDAANMSEWHNITRPEALAAQARAASRFPLAAHWQVAAQRPSAPRTSSSGWRLGNDVGNMQT